MTGNHDWLGFLLAVSAVAVWLVGGNLVLSRHYRKRGTSLLAEFHPFRFPWRELEPGERRTIKILGLVAFLLGAIAVLV